jgi:hypothetical protein
MPVCKKCSDKFSCKVKIDGKIRNLCSRHYCLVCSPFKSDTGYELRWGKKPRAEKEIKQCPCCGKEQTRYRKNIVCPTCRTVAARIKRRDKFKKLLGGKCDRCCVNDLDILHFHHLDKSKKQFNVSGQLARRTEKEILEECEKCILLCPNCHAKEHVGSHTRVKEYFGL